MVMGMSAVATIRRKAYTAALLGFRRLPTRARRSIVRVGTPSFTVGAVCAIDHDGHLLLLRQPHRHGWSLPGGLLDRGENPEQAVIREVREETGLEIEVGDPVVTAVHPGPRRVDVVFRVRVDHRPPVRVGGEAKGFTWLRPTDLTDVDDATSGILAALMREPFSRDGRLLSTA
jgi:8-oxo-dGTP diphosphatase